MKRLITTARLLLITAIVYAGLMADSDAKPDDRTLVPINAEHPWLMGDKWRVQEYKATGCWPNRLYELKRKSGVNYNDPNLK